MSQKSLDQSQTENEPASKEKRRQATIYDAVAGRVGLNGFIEKSTDITPLTPAEALFRRVNAPDELEEYNAQTNLNQKLPDSDLLQDIHRYVSEFYATRYPRDPDHGDNVDVQSLDESALLAFGILLEEACRTCLGSTGDLALTEAHGRSRNRHEEDADYQIIGRVVPEQVEVFKQSSSDESEVEEQPKKKRRRRRYRGEET